MAEQQHGTGPLFKMLLRAALVAALWLTPAQAQEDGPVAVIEQLNAALLDVMRSAEELGYQGRYEELAPVLEASYDFPLMTRIAIGTSWREMSEEQQQQLIALFTEMSIANYAARFNGYSGEEFRILGQSEGPRDAVVVESELVRPADKAVGLNYVMRDEAGGWRIVDVLLDAKYSELARQKSEFAAVLSRGGATDLAAMLQAKIDDLVAEAKS